MAVHSTKTITTLPVELLIQIASNITSAKDLKAFRLVSKPFADAGKIEIGDRLVKRKNITTNKVDDDFPGRIRPVSEQLLTLTSFPPRCWETITYLDINAEHCPEVSADEALISLTLPALRILSLNEVHCRSMRSIESILNKHATTLRELTLANCSILDNSPPANAASKAASAARLWQPLLRSLSGPAFSLERLEVTGLCLSPAAGDECAMERPSVVLEVAPFAEPLFINHLFAPYITTTMTGPRAIKDGVDKICAAEKDFDLWRLCCHAGNKKRRHQEDEDDQPKKRPRGDVA